MKPCALFVDENGIISVNYVPEEPNEKDFSGDQWKENQARREYQAALKEAVDAAVECADQGQAKEILFIHHDDPLIANNHPYIIPGLTFTKLDAKTARILSAGDRHKFMPLRGEVAILSLTTEPEKEALLSKLKAVSEKAEADDRSRRIRNTEQLLVNSDAIHPKRTEPEKEAFDRFLPCVPKEKKIKIK